MARILSNPLQASDQLVKLRDAFRIMSDTRNKKRCIAKRTLYISLENNDVPAVHKPHVAKQKHWIER